MSDWQENHEHAKLLRERTGLEARVFVKAGLTCIVSRDDLRPTAVAEPDPRWHLSLSHPERIPQWEEVADAAHELRPGVPFVFAVPPKSWWINYHPNVLHLHEVKDANLVASWREQRMAQTPTGGRKVR